MASPGSQAAGRRAEGGGSQFGGGTHGGSGAYNGQGRPNPAPTTGYGAPIHTATGPTYGGIQVAKSPEAWAALNDQVNTYNTAAGKWNAGAQKRSFANFINAMAPMGFSMQPPDFKRPSTYTGGDYHLGLNPADLVGGLLGGAAVPGLGMLTGPAAGAAYNYAGGQNLMLGGPATPKSWAMNSPPSQPSGPQMAGAPGERNSGGRPDAATQLGQLASLNANIPGNPSAPVSSGSKPSTPQSTGLDYLSRMGRIQSVTPGYGVNLPTYQYQGRATV